MSLVRQDCGLDAGHSLHCSLTARLQRRRPPFREWPAKTNHALTPETSASEPHPIFHLTRRGQCLLFCPFFWGTQKREAAAPKLSDCISGGAQEIFAKTACGKILGSCHIITFDREQPLKNRSEFSVGTEAAYIQKCAP